MAEQHFRNMDDVLPKFDPVSKRLSVDEWIEKIEEYGDLYQWDETAVRHYALSSLAGVAKQWRDSLPRRVRTWVDWKFLLRQDFPCKRNTVETRIEAQNYKQTAGQNITEYFYEKLAKCNRARMTDDEIVEWIVSGLNNSRYRDFLGPLSRYKKPSELLPDLEAGSAFIRENPVASKRVAHGATTRSASINCFVCKQPGHQARVCPNRTRATVCFKCGNTGHISRACPTTSRDGRRSDQTAISATPIATTRTGTLNQPPAVLHITEDTHRKYYKDALINGHPVKCYIDLGSSVVALRRDVADELQLTYHETALEPFVGYGAGQVRPIGIFTANISIDAVETRVTVHVVPSGSQAIPLLVGHPYTEAEGVVILSRAGELIIAPSLDNAYQATATSPVSRRTTLVSEGPYVIPRNYLGHVTVRSQLPAQDICVEGGLRTQTFSVPRCVVSTNEEGLTVLPVLNVTAAPITLHEGEVVARGEACEEEDVSEPSELVPEVNDDEVTRQEVDTDLVGEDAENLVNMLNANRDLFAKNFRQLGEASCATMRLELTTDRPIVYRPYRLSYHERKQLRDLTNELKDANVIEDSQSPFSSPVILVKKRSGDVRMCVDYRALNKVTLKDKYPLPRIDDQIDLLRGYQYYSTIDLFSGYYQIPVEPSSREKTAFVTPDGHFQFCRMPFGLTNAPAVFQRAINTILGSLRFDTAIAYLDDIVIPGRTVDEGLQRLQHVFDLLRASGLRINLKKCHYLKREIEYLGFDISAGEIRPGKRKIDCVINFPEPKNTRDVRSFVGLSSYFRRFIKNFAVKTKPLTDLLKKNAPFHWQAEQKGAFEEIKQLLSTRPVLTIYQHGVETEVHTDACAIGLGGVLLQRQLDKSWRPVSYFSRKTTPEEAKYHSYELEALAIVCALEKFRVYLIGIHFVIRTDCNSLKMLADKRDLNPRIGRWFVRLSEFDYTLQYHAGKHNQVADALSRSPAGEAEDTAVVGLPILGVRMTTDWVAAMQRSDADILRVRDELEKGDSNAHAKFTMHNARVYKVTKGRWRLYVPAELRYDVVAEAHRSLAHLGIDKTLAKLKQEYYFPKMREFVTKYVNRCIACLYHKTPSGKKPGFLHPLDKGDTPFQSIHIDHLGPLPVTERDKRYVAAAVCGFSKYVVLKAVEDVGAAGTIRFVIEFMSHYGKPMRIITDRGTAFTALSFSEFCSEYEIQHVKIATGTPRANGQVEKINDVILNCLATTTSAITCEDWDEILHEVQWAINSSYHRVTRRTPHEIVFNYKTSGWRENPLTLEVRRINDELGAEEERRDVSELLRENQGAMKRQYDKNRKAPKNYNRGDIVLVRSEAPATGESRKLAPKYRGPYEIGEVLDRDRYLVRDIEGEQQSSRVYSNVVPVDRLKYVSSAREYTHRAVTRARSNIASGETKDKNCNQDVLNLDEGVE